MVSETILTPLACDFTALRADARGYARTGGDLLFTIINELQDAKNARRPVAGVVDDKVFDGLARMAAIRGTSDQKTGVDDQGVIFNNLVHRFLGCASADVRANVLEADFAGALGDGWMFEVRGKNSDPVGPRDDPTGVAYQRGAAGAKYWWGVEPTAASWNAAITAAAPLAKRVLVYGYPTDFFTIPGALGTSFDTRTVPRIAKDVFGLAVKVGLCVYDAEDPETLITPTQRVNHDHTFYQKLTLTCGTDAPTYIAAGAPSPLNSLTQYALSLFSPKPAYAATVFFGGSIAAAPSELSPSAVYDLGLANLAFNDRTIKDTRVNTELKTESGDVLKVIATGPGDKVLPDIDIKLEIAGNESTISFFKVGSATSYFVSRKTNASGVASFDGVGVTKAGGYTLSAKIDAGGYTGPAILTYSFNVQNKK